MKTHIQKETVLSKVTVSRVYESDYQAKGTLTAELRQEVTVVSRYPGTRITNSENDNIFELSDFRMGENVYERTSQRVAWINVPDGTTLEAAREKLEKFPNAVLYRVLSNHPILSDSEQYALDSGEYPVDIGTFSDKQLVRYGDNDENAGMPIPDRNGKPQYRKICFSREHREDMDNRTDDPEDYFCTKKIAEEINGVPLKVQQ